MEFRTRSFTLRRPVLNEISSRSSGSSDLSSDFIIISDNEFVNNDRNINNNHRRSLPAEEEIIKTRGRKKGTRCSPYLRDLSPNTLVTIKSPTKNSKNEDLLKFLRSPTPRKCKHRDDTPSLSEVKRARKSLIIDLEVSNVKCTSTPTQTPVSNKKSKNSNKKTPNNSTAKKKKKFFNLRRSTNVKS